MSKPNRPSPSGTFKESSLGVLLNPFSPSTSGLPNASRWLDPDDLSRFWEGLEEPIASQDELIRALSERLYQARCDLEMLKAREVEIPEAFELHPLSSGRKKAKILKVEPGSFSFVADDEINPKDHEE